MLAALWLLTGAICKVWAVQSSQAGRGGKPSTEDCSSIAGTLTHLCKPGNSEQCSHPGPCTASCSKSRVPEAAGPLPLPCMQGRLAHLSMRIPFV